MLVPADPPTMAREVQHTLDLVGRAMQAPGVEGMPVRVDPPIMAREVLHILGPVGRAMQVRGAPVMTVPEVWPGGAQVFVDKFFTRFGQRDTTCHCLVQKARRPPARFA
jgi:hypothetical protein